MENHSKGAERGNPFPLGKEDWEDFDNRCACRTRHEPAKTRTRSLADGLAFREGVDTPSERFHSLRYWSCYS